MNFISSQTRQFLGCATTLVLAGCTTVDPAVRYLPDNPYYINDRGYSRQSKKGSELIVGVDKDPNGWGTFIAIAVRNTGKEPLTIYPERIQGFVSSAWKPWQGGDRSFPTPIKVRSARESVAEMLTEANRSAFAAALVGAIAAAQESSPVARQMIQNRTGESIEGISRGVSASIRHSGFVGRETLEPNETVVGTVSIQGVYEFSRLDLNWTVGTEEYKVSFRPEDKIVDVPLMAPAMPENTQPAKSRDDQKPPGW